MSKNSKLDRQNSEHKQGHHIVRSTSEKVNITLPTYKGDFFAASVRGTGTQLLHDFSYPVRLSTAIQLVPQYPPQRVLSREENNQNFTTQDSFFGKHQVLHQMSRPSPRMSATEN